MTDLGKNARLDELFGRWRAAYGAECRHFISDGIIDEELYEAQQPRLLFLGKDPNDPNGTEDWDFRHLWPNRTKLELKHADQVNRWAYGILNGFPPWEQAKEPPENALLKVACMNVKKTGGAGTAVADDIRHHAEQYQERIREQVEIIDPDIIIGGLRGMWVWKVLFPDLSATVEVEGVEVFRWRRAKVIDFYHPSNYYPRSMSYALLSRIFSNQKLKQL